MNSVKKGLMFIGFMLVVAVAQAGVTVTNVVIQQRYPWNGLVDIDYEVLCDNPDADIYVYPTATDHDTNLSIMPRTLTGEGSIGTVKAGKRRMTWNMAVDNPMLHSSSLSVTLSAFSGTAPYLVVDLSAGTNAVLYPIVYTNRPPDVMSDSLCRTTQLWLRLIMSGSFVMGSPANELGRSQYSNDETQHQVTLTKSYYMGIFEVTQNQWELVMGGNPSNYKGNMRPVDQVSYNMIRGDNLGNRWPTDNKVDSTSFIGVLRAKTGLIFDLPTEAQWEFACRAGTITALNSGKNITSTNICPNVAELARYIRNCSDGKGGYLSAHTKVGVYLSNAWGLYDMHGNVNEWCLDWYSTYSGNSTDPLGISSGNYRIQRGGSWLNVAHCCRSAYRLCYYSPSSADPNTGFRVVAPVLIK